MRAKNTTKKINNPHDALFKAMCTDVAIAIDLLKSALPPALFKKIDLSSLALTDKSFVSEQLRHQESDLIYQAEIHGHEGYLCFLIEHQSTANPLMAFRQLEYNVALMRQHLQQDKDKLPVIINICVYHGEVSPYPYSTCLLDCFADPKLAEEWFLKPFHLIDLTVLSDQEIERHGKVALMEFLFKHCRDAELSRRAKKLALLMRRLKADFYLHSVLYYLSAACGDQDNVDRLLIALIKALPEQEPVIMTYGQQLIEKGLKQGIQKGMQQGMQQGVQQGMQYAEQQRKEIARNMIRRGLAIDVITDTTGLDAKTVSRIRKEIMH